MKKPTTVVQMTFSADPQQGLSDNRLSGKAVVFLTTVTFGTRTAALQ